MKYVDDQSQIDKRDFEEEWFNKDGKEIFGENERFYAKSITKNGRPSYYIRVFQNTPFDPIGIYGRREREVGVEMKKVSKTTFDYYMLYLVTKNSLYMTRAQRGLHNG